jgi:hypothetical protein
MAFRKNPLTSSDLSKILDYTQYLKTEDDQAIRRFKTPEGYWFNITHIEQTPEQKDISERMQRLSVELQKSINLAKDKECQAKSADIPSTLTVEKEAEEQTPISP